MDAARRAATVSYDPSIRPVLLGIPAGERPRVEELVAAGDVVKASEDDLRRLYPGHDIQAAAARWARTGPALVVLTLASRAAAITGTRSGAHPPTRAEVKLPHA